MPRTLHGIDRTEFFWYVQGERRTFEAEEVVNLPIGDADGTTFGCRFVHSILDGDASTPIHMDGAIRLYDEAAMVDRLDSDLGRTRKGPRYKKLWRIDGALSVASWKELLCHYFRDNHLVGEYLGAAPPEEEEKASVFIPSSDPLEPFVPYNLRPGDGVQLHVSFHEKSASVPGRAVRPLDVFSLGGDVQSFIDANTTELRKLLNRSGETMSVPAEVSVVKFGDMVVNLPLIAHSGASAVILAERTLDTIGDLCQCWVANEFGDRLLSFTLAVECPDREVWFSFAGHLMDLCTWFQGHALCLPQNGEAVASWLEGVYSQLNEIFPDNHPTNLLHLLLQSSGILLFVRRFLEPESFEVRWDASQEAEVGRLKSPSPDQLKMLRDGDLQIAAAHQIMESQCSRCKQSYIECPCSKLLDPDVGQAIKGKFMGAFWTNRKV